MQTTDGRWSGSLLPFSPSLPEAETLLAFGRSMEATNLPTF